MKLLDTYCLSLSIFPAATILLLLVLSHGSCMGRNHEGNLGQPGTGRYSIAEAEETEGNDPDHSHLERCAQRTLPPAEPALQGRGYGAILIPPRLGDPEKAGVILTAEGNPTGSIVSDF